MRLFASSHAAPTLQAECSADLNPQSIVKREGLAAVAADLKKAVTSAQKIGDSVVALFASCSVDATRPFISTTSTVAIQTAASTRGDSRML